jgi:hypothetical protein
MIILISGLAVLVLGASVVTTFAALGAKDGYEDESGFHVMQPSDALPRGTKKNVGVPPFAPAR